MITTIKPYPKYKDSGVPWLGEVPEHWEVRRLRNIVEMRVSNVDKHSKEDEAPARLCNYVDVYKHERIRASMEFMKATASAEEIERFRLERGDVLITKDSEAWDDIGVPALVESSAPDLISGYHLALLRPRQLARGAFLLRVLQSRPVAYQFHVEAKGVTRYGLSHHGIKSVSVPFPLLPEQTAIVRFLDWADRRIRRVIRARKKRIELLEEYKQALINQAVTGKIDVRTGKPYPKYKDSGVAWLGKVPEHWEVRHNGTVFRERKESGREDSPILAVSLRTAVKVVSEVDEDGRPRKLIKDREKYRQARRGDIAYNTMRMWQGAVGVVPVDGLISPAYVVARPLRKNHSSYFVSLFRTQEYKNLINRYSTGIVSDRNRLYWEHFKQLPSPVPPCAEQERIAEMIDKLEAEIDRIRSSVLREIELLREYRTRLIADVVTGKLDVREAAASLPDESEEADPEESFDEPTPGDLQEEPIEEIAP